MTNKEFIRRLRKAKVEALRLWPDSFCIFRALDRNNLLLHDICMFFIPGKIGSQSSRNWVREYAKSPDDIAHVFDESIKALGGKP